MTPSLAESLFFGFTFFGVVMGGMFALAARRLNRPPRHWTPARRARFYGDDD